MASGRQQAPQDARLTADPLGDASGPLGRTRLGSRLARASSLQLFLLTAFVLLPIYLATNTTDEHQSRDAISNALPAWQLATQHRLDLEGWEVPWLTYSVEGEVVHIWYVETGDRVATRPPPGAQVFAVPFYVMLRSSPQQPDLGPAAVAASVAAALAMGLLAAVIRKMTDGASAFSAALVAGLATPVWSVASDALWQHGPAMLWAGLALVGLAFDRNALSGIGFALAIFTRPLTAVIAAVSGVLTAVRRRSWRPLVVMGALSFLGAAALIAYNSAVFGTLSPTGGYGTYPYEHLAGMGLLRYLRNLVGLLADGSRGLAVVTPFLIMLIPGLRAAWRAAPGWVRVAAIGGLAYMAIQLRVNDFSGGTHFFGYRLPLEMLVMAVPLLYLCYREWTRRVPYRRVVFWAFVAVSVGAQVFGAAFQQVGPAV